MKRHAQAVVSRKELQDMHAVLKGMAPRPPGETFSLLCSLGALLGRWPKVLAETLRDIRQRFLNITEPLLTPAAPVDKSPLEETHYQTVTLVLTDGRKVNYSGPAQIDPDDGLAVTEVRISRPAPLPAGASFDTIVGKRDDP